MIEQLMAMEGYDPKKNYVVAKHSDKFMMLRKGRIKAGEIPDATGNQDGTMVVWEIPSDDPQVVAESEPVEVVDDLPPVVEPLKTEPSRVVVAEDPAAEPSRPLPSRLKRAVKKLTGKKGTK